MFEATTAAQNGARKASSHAHTLMRNLNIIAKHVSGYPKVIYVPFLVLTSAAYGFHSVKKTKSPTLALEQPIKENPL